MVMSRLRFFSNRSVSAMLGLSCLVAAGSCVRGAWRLNTEDGPNQKIDRSFFNWQDGRLADQSVAAEISLVDGFFIVPDSPPFDGPLPVDQSVVDGPVTPPDALLPLDAGPGCLAPWGWCGVTCTDLTTTQNCGSCGNICGIGEPCVEGLCQVTLSGPLAGRFDFPGKELLIATVSVAAYNGVDEVTACDVGETGCLMITAQRIRMINTSNINAAGKGYGGGGGGGAGPGNPGGRCVDYPTCLSCSAGSKGFGATGGKDGADGNMTVAESIGGGGGAGGGSAGGAGGTTTVSAASAGPLNGMNGQHGGYDYPGDNRDSTTDMSLRLGSGGGGGGGGASAFEAFYNSVGGSGGGGAGNPGGGYVALVAVTQLVVEAGATITTRGLVSSRGNGGNGTDGNTNGMLCDRAGSGGNGGHASVAGTSTGGSGVGGFFNSGGTLTCYGPPDRLCADGGSKSIFGGNGGVGGSGAGGGVLLRASDLSFHGSIDTRGGAGGLNDGTVKLFYQGNAPNIFGIVSSNIKTLAY
jgi:hypothetical protein